MTDRRRPRHCCRRKTQGFTLLEMLIVIGIILVLVAIAVVGYNAYDRAASEKQTKVTFENLRGLVAAYERQVGGGASGRLSALAGSSDPFNDPTTPRPPGTVAMTKAPTDVNPGSNDRKRFDDFKDSKFNDLGTRRVMGELARVPENKRQLESMPPKTLLQPIRNLPATPPPLTPLLADAWGNPILFVPDGGLSGVKLTNNPTASIEIHAPANRPFFASAGPDGDFSSGDDNLYSFEQ